MTEFHPGRTLTVRDVAERLTTTPDTVRRLIRSQELVGFRLSGDRGPLRVTEADLASYVEQRRARRADPWIRTRDRRRIG